MYSWFAVFFPLMDPILVKDKEKLLIRVWRKTKPEKVWYEWQVDLISDTNTVLKSTIVHNVDGERLSILK
jgi:protein arginine N-methyltransferase 5